LIRTKDQDANSGNLTGSGNTFRALDEVLGVLGLKRMKDYL